MTIWYQNNQRLYRNERAALAAAQPCMALDIRQAGFRINQKLSLRKECAVAVGTYSVQAPETGQYDYQIAVVLPENYPASPCVVYCDDPKLPIGNLDRHILTNGQACLSVPADLRSRWKPESGLVGFLHEFVSPFIAWQVYYDAHGHPPPWGQRSHGVQGIVEFYAEVLNITLDLRVPAFMPLLARKNPPKGHEPCPCDSGRRLRDCHAASVRKARELVQWQAVASDLATFGQIEKEVKHDAFR